jgi:hypothetical protein
MQGLISGEAHLSHRSQSSRYPSGRAARAETLEPRLLFATVNARDDAFVGIEGFHFGTSGGVGTPATSLLANDANAISVALMSGPSNGRIASFLPDGTFDYVPKPDFFGNDSFTYRAVGADGSSDVATVKLTILLKNDAPTIIDGPSVTAPEDVPFEAKNWADVSPGDPYESDQEVVSFITQNSNPGLFAMQPWVDTAGTLRFTPTLNATGIADVIFFVRDDGGTENNGKDTSTSGAKVRITVVNTPDKPAGVTDTYSVYQGRTLAHTPRSKSVSVYKYASGGVTTVYTLAEGSFEFRWMNPEIINGETLVVRYELRQGGSQEFYFYPPYAKQLKAGAQGAIIGQLDPRGPGPTMFTRGTLPNGNAFVGGRYTVTQFVPGRDLPARLTMEFESADQSLKATLQVNAGVDTNVLANDVEPDGDVVTASLITTAKHGTLDFRSDGTFDYAPAAGFIGRDTFTYQPIDATGSGNVTTVNIDVVPPPPPKGAIRGTVFDDRDGDGVWEAGEAGLSGRRLFIDTDGDGVRDASEPTTITGPKGGYALEGVVGGTHNVMQLPPTGWRGTWPEGPALRVTLDHDQVIINRNFGQTDGARVAGSVFMDANVDGALTQGESPLPGWRVFIDADGDGMLDIDEPTVVTDPAGRYAFDDLAPGTHRVRLAQSPAYRLTAPAAGYRDVTVGAGESIGGRNFGEKRIVRTANLSATPTHALTAAPTTPPGFSLIANINDKPVPTTAVPLLSVNNLLIVKLFGNGTTHGLFATDGTAAGTVMLFDGNVDDIGDSTAVVSHTGYFTYRARNYDQWQLWRTDGTPQGTSLIRNLGSPEMSGDDMRDLAALNGRVIFSNHARGGLWSSDGTPEGTVPIYSVYPDGDVLVVGDRGYFVVSNEMFVTDGTLAGTRKAGNVVSSGMNRRATFGDGFVFTDGRDQLFVSDGTTAHIINDANGNPVTGVDSMLGVGANLFVWGIYNNRRGLWATDRSFTQWNLVGDGGDCVGSVGNLVIFAYKNYLWSSDGFSTTRLRAYSGTIDGGNKYKTAVNIGRRLMFLAGKEVLITDGTASGTYALGDGTFYAYNSLYST